MTTTTAQQDRIAEGRLLKALALAAVLREADCDPDAVARLDEEGRARALAAAGIKSGEASEATWKTVVLVMRRLCPHGHLLRAEGARCPEWHRPRPTPATPSRSRPRR